MKRIDSAVRIAPSVRAENTTAKALIGAFNFPYAQVDLGSSIMLMLDRQTRMKLSFDGAVFEAKVINLTNGLVDEQTFALRTFCSPRKNCYGEIESPAVETFRGEDYWRGGAPTEEELNELFSAVRRYADAFAEESAPASLRAKAERDSLCAERLDRLTTEEIDFFASII